jgi:hypothetical protein
MFVAKCGKDDRDDAVTLLIPAVRRRPYVLGFSQE